MAEPPGSKRRRGYDGEPPSMLRDLMDEEGGPVVRDEPIFEVERKAFADLLRTTPAAPLGPFEKTGLIATAVVVVILFGVSLWRMTQKPSGAGGRGPAASAVGRPSP